MTTFGQRKGNVGHAYTKVWLEKQGWSVWVKPHQTTAWRGNHLEWHTTGSNDIFAAPAEDNPKKKKGGFDILAVKGETYSLWQVKKTKANPFTPSFKKEIELSITHNKLNPTCCHAIWWPDGEGPESKTGPTLLHFGGV